MAEPHFGFTKKTQVVRNAVSWNNRFTFSVKFGAAGERGEELRSCGLRISIREEKNTGLGHIRHGIVELDLADYAGLPTVQKNFLLQESRTNAVLSLSLTLRQTSGDPTFKRPFKNVAVNLPSFTEGTTSSISVLQSSFGAEESARTTGETRVDKDSNFVDSGIAEKNFFHSLENNPKNSMDLSEVSSQNMEWLEQKLEEEIPSYIRATRIDAEALIDRIIRDIIPDKGDEVEETNLSRVGDNISDKAVNDEAEKHRRDLDITLLKKTRDSGRLFSCYCYFVLIFVLGALYTGIE